MRDDLSIMLAIDTLDAGDLRTFVTSMGEPKIGLSPSIEIRDDCVLRSVCGYGENFSEALHDLWRQLTEYDSSKQYLVINAGSEKRRALRWNGVGFKPVYEPERML
jgi:hypothetical protein